jgi:hypothetical protein
MYKKTFASHPIPVISGSFSPSLPPTFDKLSRLGGIQVYCPG